MKNYQTIVVGAGIVGIATAYSLAVKYRQNNILLVDKLPPMSLTTSKSGENFRDYWPQACMTDFTSRSLNLMEELIAEHGNVFNMRSSGYDFISERVDQEIFPTPLVQFSGYYTRTAENWPLIGPLHRPGLFVAAALSGYGTMAACAAGELCAKHILGEAKPGYAPYFHPNRYQDPGIRAEMANLTSDGQL